MYKQLWENFQLAIIISYSLTSKSIIRSKKFIILLFYAKQVYNVVKIAATKENIMELFIVDACCICLCHSISAKT